MILEVSVEFVGHLDGGSKRNSKTCKMYYLLNRFRDFFVFQGVPLLRQILVVIDTPMNWGDTRSFCRICGSPR